MLRVPGSFEEREERRRSWIRACGRGILQGVIPPCRDWRVRCRSSAVEVSLGAVMGLYGRVRKPCIRAHDGQRHLDDTENHEKCSTILNDLPANGRRTVAEVDRVNAALAWMVIGIKTENQSPVQRLTQAWLSCDRILAQKQSQQAPDR
jgi:hypothetical protein